MNLQETIALIDALKSAGVTKFKSLEHDISFDGKPSQVIHPMHKYSHKPEEPINHEATEKIKDLISTLKLSDEELANKMFPDGAI